MISRRLYWRAYAIRQDRLEKKFITSLIKLFNKNIFQFINYVKTNGIGAASIADNVIDKKELENLLKDFYRICAAHQANKVLRDLKTQKSNHLLLGLEQLAPVIDKYFELYLFENAVLPISTTTRKTLVDYVLKRMARGDSLDDALVGLKKLALEGGIPVSRARAKVIAQTESTRAMNFGGFIGAYMSGKDVDKIWVTCEDERVRDPRKLIYRNNPFSHEKLDGVRIDMMGTFYNPGPIKFPGDPDADFKNTVNCRCCLLFAEKVVSVPEPIVFAPPRRRERTLANFIIDVLQGFILGGTLGNLLDQLTVQWQDSNIE